MKLPGVSNAIVPPTKITEYLLSQAHPTGQRKAIFFRRCGFAAENWRSLATALIYHAQQHEVAAIAETRFGTKYIIDGELDTPSATEPEVRVVWFVEKGETAPRLVTAYPRQGAKR